MLLSVHGLPDGSEYPAEDYVQRFSRISGEEICINYTGDPGDDSMQWFTDRNIKFINP